MTWTTEKPEIKKDCLIIVSNYSDRFTLFRVEKDDDLYLYDPVTSIFVDMYCNLVAKRYCVVDLPELPEGE